jgi:hypothetical protein
MVALVILVNMAFYAFALGRGADGNARGSAGLGRGASSVSSSAPGLARRATVLGTGVAAWEA